MCASFYKCFYSYKNIAIAVQQRPSVKELYTPCLGFGLKSLLHNSFTQKYLLFKKHYGNYVALYATPPDFLNGYLQVLAQDCRDGIQTIVH